jgi:cobalt/nickel transport system permease protein
MHVPDGFLDVPTSIATGVVAAGAIGIALKKSRSELDEKVAPMAGLTAAFVFAVQMINFPVGVGTSGHLMGGALAAVLVGPWTAVLVLSVVLMVQALVFADGGLTALGTNITLIGLVTVFVGWTVTKFVLQFLPKRPTSVVPAAFVGALLSVPAAAGVFVLLYSVGGATGLPFGALMATMLGWHTLIGLGEAFITAATVGAVVAVRPDLVYAARGLTKQLVLRTPDGQEIPASDVEVVDDQPRHSIWPLAVGAMGVTMLIAGALSFFASSNPDGLEYVAEEQGFIDAAEDSAVAGWSMADYGEVGGIPVGVAGLIGVGLTILIGLAVFALVTRTSRARESVRA